MLFASNHPVIRRNVSVHTGGALEQFLNDARLGAKRPTTQYRQDDAAFYLTLDVPGIARAQLSISIEAAVVRIESREGAPRTYRAAYELPQELDAALSEAKLDNGVLDLKLAKKVQISKATEISIQ